MNTQCLVWLILLSICNLGVYERVVKLYEKVEHLLFLVEVEEKRRRNEEES